MKKSLAGKNNPNYRHGHRSSIKPSRTYTAWSEMIQRCINKNSTGYKNYGARGISVCDRWKEFENFLIDMGEKPKGFDLDRIDNNGNYNKENCRYVTRSINDANRNAYGKLKIKGVDKRADGTYISKIRINGKLKYLGSFKCPVLASTAFQLKHNEVYGG